MHGASTLWRHSLAGRLVALGGILLAVMALALAPARAGTALAATGAVNTTYDTTVDGTGHCLHGSIINCNAYDGKQYVWLSGSPIAAALGPGTYFFAVGDPGYQRDPNDGAQDLLSCASTGDPWTNRVINVDSTGVMTLNSTFTSTHSFDPTYTDGHSAAYGAIRLGLGSCGWYATTSNPGGVYILAVCQINPSTYNPISNPVDPRSCKYDAFKVVARKVTFQSVLSGFKIWDQDGNGLLEPGEAALSGWHVQIFNASNTLLADLTTSANGSWTWVSPTLTGPGTTSYTICEVQQSGWTQTGPIGTSTVDATSNTTVSVTGTLGDPTHAAGNCYLVTVPNNDNSSVSGLDFFNKQNSPPICNLTASGTNVNGQAYIQVTVQASNGLKSVQVTELNNATAQWDNPVVAIALYGYAPVTTGDTTAHVVTATKTDQTVGSQLALQVIDTLGNVVNCDPVQTAAIRSAGQPQVQSVAGVQQADHLMTVFNGTAGVTNLTVTVNGQAFTLRGLGANERVTIDVASALTSGANTVTLETTGQPGGSASVLFGNIK